MNISELYDEIQNDLKIDDTELDLESIKTPQLHNKYLKLYTTYSLQLKKLQDDKKILYRDKWEYYTGKASSEVYMEKPFDLKVLKADVGIYIDSDSQMQELGQKVEYIKQIVNYLEKILREIKWKKFIHGE